MKTISVLINVHNNIINKKTILCGMVAQKNLLIHPKEENGEQKYLKEMLIPVKIVENLEKIRI